MSPACARFRAELEEALARGRERLARLASDEHARACARCRALWTNELGLERVLARVPAPEAPPGLARRVLAGLAAERHDPAAGLGAGRADELEELLASLPAPAAPAGLAGRVLAGLAPERAPRRVRRPWLLPCAAGLLAGLTFWAWTLRRPEPARLELVLEPVPDSELLADEELLAYAVERWELLHDEDLDVWLASLDPVDELLLEYELLEYDELLLQDAGGWLEGSGEPGPERGD
jgi:hypothetical protein